MMHAHRLMPLLLAAVLLDQKSPEDLFRQLFFPIEKTMGIKISPSKLQVSLLSGKVTVPEIVLEHPVQGKFATLKGIEFPLGFLFGTVQPGDGAIEVQEAVVSLTLSDGKFWDQKTADGKPIPGAPNIMAGKIHFKKATVSVRQGKASPLVLEGTEATISGVKLPATAWSKGDAPAGVWAKLALKGGKAYREGGGAKWALKGLELAFNAEMLQVKDLRVEAEGGGSIAAKGSIDCLGAEPRLFDLTLSLAGWKPFPGDDAFALGGDLKLSGKKGQLKIGGTVEAAQAVEKSWDRQECNWGIVLDVKVVRAGDPGKTLLGKISGDVCHGKITAAGGGGAKGAKGK